MNGTSPPYYLVIGLGASGFSMARFLNAKGKKVVATDIDAAKTDAAKELNALGIETQIGYHDPATFNRAGFLVPSPGIPLTDRYIKSALENGVPLTCELDIFSRYNRLPVIAITGTNGKTTTTTLIGNILSACGKKPFVGGNIGTPLLEQLMSDEDVDIIVAEISSFQLDLSSIFKPDVGLLLNISEDHLDRYNGFEAYVDAKWRLFEHQTALDTAIINARATSLKQKKTGLKSNCLLFSSDSSLPVFPGAEIQDSSIRFKLENNSYRISLEQLKAFYGVHNHENLAAAVLACLSTGCEFNDILMGLQTFTPLPHRMEWVKSIKGVSFYNDSKATNADAVNRALAYFKGPVFLILGGREKNTDFALLKKAVQKHVKSVMAIGESKNHVKNTFKAICPVVEAETMEQAVQTAFNRAGKGDTVLLSPACASFDMYQNYAHRGDDFKHIVRGLEK